MDFDDSGWAAATEYGQYGVGPWFKNVAGFPVNSVAQWIWSSDNNANNTVYFRYVVTVDSGGSTTISSEDLLPLRINTTSLPNGRVGVEYTQPLTASGGAPPHSWIVTTGDLPEGLALDQITGEIYGTPSRVETVNISVQVTDNSGATTSQSLTLRIMSDQVGFQAAINISGDNAEELYVNGVLVGSSSVWSEASSYVVDLQVGENVIAVKGMNAADMAALIAELVWGSNTAVSDGSWKVSTVLQAGWQNVGFDDNGWAAATEYGQYGVEPWFKNVVGFPVDSVAQWIWSSNDQDQTVFFRYTFLNGP